MGSLRGFILTPGLLVIGIMFLGATAHAAQTDQYLRAASNASFIDTADGLRLEPRAFNVVVSRFGRCRFLDSGTNIEYFVPLGSDRDWRAFVENAPTEVTLSFCRPTYSVTHDFGGVALAPGERLTNASGRLDLGDGTYTDTALFSGVLHQTYSYNLARSAALAESKANTVTFRRRDCRPNLSHTGASRGGDVCSTHMWVETGNIDIAFIPPTGSPRDGAAADGVWSLTARPKNGGPPPISFPASRTCPPQLHNQRHWINSTTQTRAADSAECPHGAGTALYQRTERLEYVCFDGVDEPTGGVSYTSWQFAGGQCAPAPQINCGPGYAKDSGGVCQPVSPVGLRGTPNALFYPAASMGWVEGSARYACAAGGFTRLHDFSGWADGRKKPGKGCGKSDTYHEVKTFVGNVSDDNSVLNLGNYPVTWTDGKDTNCMGYMTMALCSGPNYLTPSVTTLVADTTDSNAVAAPAGFDECPADLNLVGDWIANNANYFLTAKTYVGGSSGDHRLRTASEYTGGYTPVIATQTLNCFKQSAWTTADYDYGAPADQWVSTWYCDYFGCYEYATPPIVYQTHYSLHTVTTTLHTP